MSKALLMASLAMMVVLPLRAARIKNPKVALKRAITTTLLFNVAWAAVVLVIFLVLLRNPAQLMPESVNP
ncbi:MAG: hypothetical protein IPJ65_34720 [Archangiaceae bacterium]|nr:hypothetical protein [Archangiaceae bacterium]